MKICLVGYPKSGTSWAIRLIAHSTQIPIKLMDKSNNSIIEINQRLQLKEGNGFIYKTHLKPKGLIETDLIEPNRIIYLYRDPRSVFVSAFFYFIIKKNYAFLFRLKRDVKQTRIKQFIRILLFPISRMFFHHHLRRMAKSGVAKGNYGSWSDHLRSWVKELGENKRHTKFAIVSYEQLIKRPRFTLQTLFKSLDLPLDSKNNKLLLEAIEQESMKSMLERINKSSKVEFAKLRTGTVDDWKNYLSKRNLALILDEIEQFGVLNEQLGFKR